MDTADRLELVEEREMSFLPLAPDAYTPSRRRPPAVMRPGGWAVSPSVGEPLLSCCPVACGRVILLRARPWPATGPLARAPASRLTPSHKRTRLPPGRDEVAGDGKELAMEHAGLGHEEEHLDLMGSSSPMEEQPWRARGELLWARSEEGKQRGELH